MRTRKVIPIFIITVAVVCGAIYFINLPRGKAIYDDSLSVENKTLFEETLKDEKFKNDVTISSEVVENIDGLSLIHI